MIHSGKSVRQAVTLTLILICLLNAPVGRAHAWRQPALTPQPHSAAPAPRELDSGAPLSSANQKTKARVGEAFGKLPLRFEANAGQTDERVKFISRGRGYSLFLTSTEAVMRLRTADLESPSKESAASIGARTIKPQSQRLTSQSIVRMKFVDGASNPKIDGLEQLPGKSNYFIGKDPAKWRRNVASYARVRYQNIYPGIDMIYYGAQGQIEYDFVVAPRANPNAIRLGFDGIERMELDATGDLILYTPGGQVRQRKPLVYQEVKGGRQEIAGRYALKGEREVGFEVGAYDRNRPLVIDPVLAYSTFLGGASTDAAQAVAVDSVGNAYVAGFTDSVDFPTVNALQPMPGNPDPNRFPADAFVAKFNRDGSALLYSTYLGGNDIDYARGIAVDRNGSVCVTGVATSKDFPTKNAIQPAQADGPDLEFFGDAFVAKLNAEGSALVFSTYLGGENTDGGLGLALDRVGDIYVVGLTDSSNFPTQRPLQPALKGVENGFVAKLNASGSKLVYSTYLGGSIGDYCVSVAVDNFGAAYITGATGSEDFPTANPLQPTLAGEADAFVAKLDAKGASLVYSTYLGGATYDAGASIAVDAIGNAYVGGQTFSTDFPLKNPLQGALAGPSDAFIAKFNPTGSALRYSTYLGGAQNEITNGIAVDQQGQVYVIGATGATDFPTRDSIQPKPDIFESSPFFDNAFLTVLNAECSGLVYSTYLGGRKRDFANGVALDVLGNVYVVGETESEDLPTTPGAFQRALGVLVIPHLPPFETSDAFIMKIFNWRFHNDADEDR